MWEKDKMLKTLFSGSDLSTYFGIYMDHPYSTLQTIYTIVKDDPDPTSYPCKPAQIIVRQFLPWDTILEHIHQLAKQGLVELHQQERFTLVKITSEGFALCRSGGAAASVNFSV